MARIEEKVRSLVSEDAEMRSAIETVLERAEDGEVKWVDVREDLTSGQWGRLIEKGVLTDGEEGFALADPDATRAGLEDPEEVVASTGSSDGDEPETTKWSKWDKGAALVSIALFAGYSWAPMRNIIGTVMDVALGPLQSLLPFYVVIMVLALVTGLYSTLLQANLMDMEKMSKYQDRMKAIQEKRKKAKEAGDDEALEKIQEEQMDAMGDQMGMFKEQFRPMVWIMFITIPVFLWMYWSIGARGGTNHHDLANVVLPLVGDVAWTDPVVGPIQAWIVWYFLCSMAFTQIIRKGLNIETTPSTS